ncbi:MAG: AtpZ/AtpI family protein [bacterium]|nr:AtpZ/AtpI family protein [bacterium]
MEKKPQINQFIKYSSQATQMILVIVAGSLGGKYLDAYMANSFPIFTLLGVIISVFAALYLAVKDFLKK